MSEWGEFKGFISGYLNKRSEFLVCSHGNLSIKKAKKGIHTGDLFFGCKDYPEGYSQILNFMNKIVKILKKPIHKSQSVTVE